ncbi:hypothetical protein CAEBREN_03317 [Caenorhabditis brenneri]|uniref:Uncharacterized protein n=1 Tax=Caenorhabditis brenneri TaxID=135651 RepID=G0MML8_CAEBE|nr:hypothetical protein CAEBREN_03317 [Caenorhabditis brenneri]
MSLKSLQFLLKHMDANKRFEISQHCPALREFEKSVPLNINCLALRENSVIVNNTTYEIGIIRECKVGEAPKHVSEKNERGGDPYELDRNAIIPMSENTQLKVSYGPFPEFAPRSNWAFKFLTELIEH